MRRLLWFLGVCDLVWIYNTDGTDVELRILYCDERERKYVCLNLPGMGYTPLLADDKISGYTWRRWKLYSPWNKPCQNIMLLKMCKRKDLNV